uniref:Claudin-10-like n=1 Tax=Astyanax mexicanus TaxID=7994 RepID=W5L3W5_ASTMX
EDTSSPYSTRRHNMKYRSVVMYIEIGCFVACVCGWILVCATLPIQYWTYSEVATSVLTNSHTFSNLWKDCMTDLTGMVDCKVFPSLLSLQMYIHLCRATIFTSIVLGFLGAILALIGMKCTKLGGSEITNSKITLAAGMIYLASGLCAMFAFSWYGNKIITEFMDPTHRTKKFELGVALFVGWGGSSLLIIGGLVYSIFGGREAQSTRRNWCTLHPERPLLTCLNQSKRKRNSHLHRFLPSKLSRRKTQKNLWVKPTTRENMFRLIYVTVHFPFIISLN